MEPPKRKRIQFQGETYQKNIDNQTTEQIPSYASIIKPKQTTSDGTETLVTQTCEITTLLGEGILEYKLLQTCEMMQQSMKYQEERLGQLKQQLIQQTWEAAIQVEQRFEDAARTMETKIAESALLESSSNCEGKLVCSGTCSLHVTKLVQTHVHEY